jgi:S-sulfo-L-cysteine synthase (O-acetyl-L-serine-dependent)
MLKTAEKLDSGLLVGIFADDGRKFKSLYMQQNVFTGDEYDREIKSAKNLSNAAFMLN